MTKGDRIRNMSDEELAKLFSSTETYEGITGNFISIPISGRYQEMEHSFYAILRFLQSS